MSGKRPASERGMGTSQWSLKWRAKQKAEEYILEICENGTEKEMHVKENEYSVYEEAHAYVNNSGNITFWKGCSEDGDSSPSKNAGSTTGEVESEGDISCNTMSQAETDDRDLYGFMIGPSDQPCLGDIMAQEPVNKFSDDDHNDDKGSDGEPDLADEIGSWAVKHKITHRALGDLLHILCKKNPSLPKDPRTLLKTSTSITVKPIAGGLYHHFGISKGINQMLYPESIPGVKKLLLQINIDGLPLFKSSKLQFWPILGMLDHKGLKQPFLIGLFRGSACDQNYPLLKMEHSNGPVPELFEVYNQYGQLFLPRFCITLDQANNCVLLNGEICIVQNLLAKHGQSEDIFLVVKQFAEVNDFFKHPLRSSDLGIHHVSNLKPELVVVSISRLNGKCALWPSKSGYIAVPLNHTNE
ncbi:uncharacterized protein LOC143242660 [Tachypleus tridentatus]|uniref:uncharacterized protein LOC143242660 n=1 Tax=Tachypleus tridentatus TaxID=6853 RepID=UPI003FD2994E